MTCWEASAGFNVAVKFCEALSVLSMPVVIWLNGVFSSMPVGDWTTFTLNWLDVIMYLCSLSHKFDVMVTVPLFNPLTVIFLPSLVCLSTVAMVSSPEM